MTALITRANALQLPLPDESVDLIVTSPPYFSLRSYRDGDSHYDGQIGSEPTPQDFLEALWAATAELVRVLKPSGSIFVNLGDKYAGSGGHNNAGLVVENRSARFPTRQGKPVTPHKEAQFAVTRRNAPDRYNQNSGGIPAKSLMGLPWRYANGCVDHLGLILRAEIVWSKPNSLPESVRDRVRRSHEQWFHFTKEPRYFTAIDEIREPYAEKTFTTLNSSLTGQRGLTEYANSKMSTWGEEQGLTRADIMNPLGKLPGSVWSIPSEPLRVPPELGVDHFAAFPQEWPRRLILGWSPSGICVECGEGRRPVVAASYDREGRTTNGPQSVERRHESPGREVRAVRQTAITGYACACTPYTDHPERRGRSFHAHGADDESGHSQDGSARNKAYREGRAGSSGPVREYHFEDWTPAHARPAVVLDPFGGTGTTAMVARALGRVGVSVDLSHDYCRLAQWRVFESGHWQKTLDRTYGKPAKKQRAKKPAKLADVIELKEQTLFDEEGAA